MPVHIPMRTDPHRATMRPPHPVTARPDPLAAPFPAAGRPDPQLRRAGGHRDDFGLRRWRSRGFRHDGRSGGRCGSINRAVAIDHLSFHTARKKWQAGDNQNRFCQSRNFHKQNARRGGDENVSQTLPQSVGGGGLLGVDHALEQKHQRDAPQRHQAEQIEIIHERQ